MATISGMEQDQFSVEILLYRDNVWIELEHCTWHNTKLWKINELSMRNDMVINGSTSALYKGLIVRWNK